MIKLTIHASGSPIYINPKSIRSITTSKADGTFVHYIYGNFVAVSESPDTVAHLITEYRQRQMRLQAAYGALYHGWEMKDAGDELDQLESEDRP